MTEFSSRERADNSSRHPSSFGIDPLSRPSIIFKNLSASKYPNCGGIVPARDPGIDIGRTLSGSPRILTPTQSEIGMSEFHSSGTFTSSQGVSRFDKYLAVENETGVALGFANDEAVRTRQ